jgi:hypothetical protein
MLWNTSRFLQSSWKRAELRRRKTKRHNSCWRKRKKKDHRWHSITASSSSSTAFLRFLGKVFDWGCAKRSHACAPSSPCRRRRLSCSTHALQALKKHFHPHGWDMSIHIMSDSSIFSTPLEMLCDLSHPKVTSVFSLFLQISAYPGCAQDVTLQTCFSHPSLGVYFLSTSPTKGQKDCK